MNTQRILVAEDDESDAVLLKRAFNKAGVLAELHLANDGLEAVTLLEQSLLADDIPALLLLDLKMPRMSGFEVMEWLQTRSEFQGVSVVVLSSSDDPRDIMRASRLGASHYLVKPNDPSQLVEIARRLGDYLNHQEPILGCVAA